MLGVGDGSEETVVGVLTKERLIREDLHILQFFKWSHLPIDLQAVSVPFHTMAEAIVAQLPVNYERTAALRKLLEAKDCAVRAAIAK